jgi:hypothetical protein
MADNVEQVDALVKEEKWITVTDIVDMLDINSGTAYFIVQEDLRYHKICGRWIPRQLPYKQPHMEMCMQFLQQYHERELFLQQIVTGDETWVHHYESASKYQSTEWKYT